MIFSCVYFNYILCKTTILLNTENGFLLYEIKENTTQVYWVFFYFMREINIPGGPEIRGQYQKCNFLM